MNVPFLDLGWQETQIHEDREKRFNDIIQNSAFVLGAPVAHFETEFAKYCERDFAVGVSSGTDALTMIFNALGLQKDDEVITIPTTFFASATAVIHGGGRPVFVDIDPLTRNFDFEKLEAAITSKTKAIVPVHLYGIPVNMTVVMDIAKRHNLLVIEDCCQAHCALFEGKRVGSFGEAAAFSFYPGKNLGAYGDGGAVVTNNEEIAKHVKAQRNQGCVEKYDHTVLGYNGRLDALQAAVLSSKLPYLDAWNQLRREIADEYQAAFAELQVGLPLVPTGAIPVWHLFVLQLHAGNRDAFMSHMKERGVATGIHYPIALHRTPALAFLGYKERDFPIAEALASQCVSLPVYPGMSKEQVHYVIETVKSYFI